jgi:hypothetical protein
MPKIFQYLGYIFFFYSNEHLPIHCHVKKGEKEIKAVLNFHEGRLLVKFLKVRGKNGFEGNQLAVIETFVKNYHEQIVEKWKQFFIYGKSPNFEVIPRSK